VDAEARRGWVVRFMGMTATFTMQAAQVRRVHCIRIGHAPIDLSRTCLITVRLPIRRLTC